MMDKDRVLLVDDEVEFVEALAERLRTRGLLVHTACCGPDALAEVEKRDHDVMILDLAMPGMGGDEVLLRLRQSHPMLQIILLTGHATVPLAVDMLKHGAFDLLEKPANMDELLVRIREARRRKVALLEQESQTHIDEILKRRGW